MSDDASTGTGMTGQPEPGEQEGRQPRFGAGRGGWQPLGEYDAEATMHVSFMGPFPDPIAVSNGIDPLAAPGHGYAPAPPPATPPPAAPPPVPPSDQDDAAPGSWWQPGDAPPHQRIGHGDAPFEGASWQPAGGVEQAAQDAATHWSVPFVPDDVAENSGEYSVGAMVTAPAERGESVVAPAGQPPDPEAPEFSQPADPSPFSEPPGATDLPGPPERRIPEPEPLAELSGEAPSDHPTVSYVLHVNGSDRPVTDAWLGESLLYVLRERLGLAGVKDGCEQGECGACSVQVDGRLIASCLLPAATAAGSEVRTVEALSAEGRPSDVQRALAESGAVQCGFCMPGMVMTVHDLLEGNHRPTELQIRQALSGNLCRCSGYQGVLDAVREVVASRAAAAQDAASAEEPGTTDSLRIPQQSSGPVDGGAAV